jgi:hypothetical protein
MTGARGFSGFLLLTLWASAAVCIAETPSSEQPPTLPIDTVTGEAIEPEVAIIETDKGTIYEYRVGGHMYMVKIVPTAGPPYYLLDTDGDGQLDAQRNDITDISIPQWVLYSW